MKKKLLKGLVGISMLALAFGVNAETIISPEEGSNTASKDATVGTVEGGGTHNIEIEWGSFEYNWIYNEQTLEYEWEVAAEDNAYIYVTDSSFVKEISPVITWEPTEKYDFVDAEFEYRDEGFSYVCTEIIDEYDFESANENFGIYSDAECQSLMDPKPESFVPNSMYTLTTTEKIEKAINTVTPPGINLSATQNGPLYYNINNIKLINNYEKNVSVPTAGEKIGTFTITIEKNS